MATPPTDEHALARLAVRLGAATVPGWSAAEQRLTEMAARGSAAPAASDNHEARTRPYGEPLGAFPLDPAEWLGAQAGAGVDRAEWFEAQAGAGVDPAEWFRAQIRAGGDPLGGVFCRLRPAARRRASGQTLTPGPVVQSMIRWAQRTVQPVRVVDPGAGSARFLVAAGGAWPDAALLGVETDPLAAMLGRATLAAAGMAERATIMLTDYRSLRLPPAPGPTLFIGNPPYVRHHQVPSAWKDWFRRTAADMGLTGSGLAGLHAHFFLATVQHAVPGDAGALLTAAEWLDVNYGALIRALVLGSLGGDAIHVIDPDAAVFADALTTSAITCFRPGTRPQAIRLRRVPGVAELGRLAGGVPIPAATLRAAPRWGVFLSPPAAKPRRLASWQTELGEICRVHRGQVTGANSVWITSPAEARLPHRFLFPAVTRASELFRADGKLVNASALRRVIDLPADIDELPDPERALVQVFLARARAAGAADSYVARHRTPWWRVRLRSPAPILATYMARRPPAFVRNLASVRHVNIAHGLYPREPLSEAALNGLAVFLRQSAAREYGRTYAGGLTKFEPREMERLPVPGPELLAGYASPGSLSQAPRPSSLSVPAQSAGEPPAQGRSRR